VPTSSKGAKAPPDTCWHGPAAHSDHYVTTASDGWYYWTVLDNAVNQDKIWVKFTNDIWANPAATVTRVDWSMDMSTTYNNTTSNTEYSAYIGYGSDTLHYTGAWYIGATSGGTTAWYEFTWTNLSRYGWGPATPRTCSGTFSYTSSVGVSGSYTFTNGAGTGTCSYGGETIASFVFHNDGTGYYTITGGTTQYPFSW
ncbi:MAG TPA: hypothetical protein VMF29_08925, partial [Candidatus Edwardsbacteria bacterium]|nr:hypothetical protein [Candidatus Edwardsbacteria bacterium]